MCEAYTRVLQGHVRFSTPLIRSFSHYGVLQSIKQIAIDTAIFPEGTSGRQLDVLARKALWKDGLNYMVGLISDIDTCSWVDEGTFFSMALVTVSAHS